jgi:hypothetical protein
MPPRPDRRGDDVNGDPAPAAIELSPTTAIVVISVETDGTGGRAGSEGV